MADRRRRRKSKDKSQDGRLWPAALNGMEGRIFDALADGKTRREICREQGIGHTAYDTYLAFVRRYLGVRTTAHAVAIYIREKIRREEEDQEEKE